MGEPREIWAWQTEKKWKDTVLNVTITRYVVKIVGRWEISGGC